MTKITLEELDDEYLSLGDVLRDEIDTIKQVIRAMDDDDRYLMLLYAHFHSLRKVAEIIGISHSKVSTEIKRIRANIGERTLYT